VAIADILATLQTDKKVKAGKVRFVLPTRIGEVVVTDEIPEATLVEVLRDLGAVG
jgi:3-dehydroquinate synthase